MVSNIEVGKMAAYGEYSKIGLNTSLKRMGVKGGLKRPDAMGIAKKRANKVIEVVSPRQSISSVKNKVEWMKLKNPGLKGKVVSWVRRLFK